MTRSPFPGGGPLSRRRRVESAAVAGVVYAILTGLTLVITWSVPSSLQSEAEWETWIGESVNRGWLLAALNLASIGAVAFLWFVAVIRRRLGDREDRFFATVFFGSALVYVGLWLVAASILAAPALIATPDRTVSVDAVRFAEAFAEGLLLVATPRIQAVFIATSSTLFLRTKVLPRWLAYLGYALALVMLVIPFVATPLGLGLPVFVLIASITVFFSRRDIEARAADLADQSHLDRSATILDETE